MATILRNALALIIGAMVGGSVNMGLILLGSSVVPAPLGVDVTDTESVRAGMHLFEAKHFVFPFLAHAFGTLVGAICAFLIAATHRVAIGYVIGALFLAGGIAAAFMIPAPTWFVVVDLVVAYLPMAYIGTRIGGRILG